MKKIEQRTIEFGTPPIDNQHKPKEIWLAEFIRNKDPLNFKDRHNLPVLTQTKLMEYVIIKNAVTAGVTFTEETLHEFWLNIRTNMTNDIHCDMNINPRDPTLKTKQSLFNNINVMSHPSRTGNYKLFQVLNDIKITLSQP